MTIIKPNTPLEKLSKDDQKEAAKGLWEKGFKANQIKDFLELDASLRAVFQWIDIWKKEEYYPEQAIFAADARFIELMQKQDKSPTEIAEMQIYADLIKTADTNRKAVEVKKIAKGAVWTTDESGEQVKKEPSKKRKAHKNSIDHITDEMFEAFEKTLYYHQLICLEAAFNPDVNAMRLILKPRQAGQTFVEAYIAFKRAVKTGDAHSFLSATIPQAMVFNAYIKDIATQFFNCDIFEGTKKIVLRKEGKLWGSFEFISSKVFSAQGRASHVIFDECAWVMGFSKVDDVANAMATQDGYTLVYLTTPSTTLHDFYEYWTGERFNKYQPPHDKINIDIKIGTFLKLNKGRLDGDGFWRYSYTIDSVLQNNPEFPYTIEKLQKRCPNPRTFDCIYRCVFTDDSDSEFTIKQLLRCMVQDEKWHKHIKSIHKTGCAYDPSSGSESSGDEAAIGYIELPNDNEEPFRLLLCSNFDQGSAKTHVEHFKERKKAYDISRFFTDVSGSGIYVWQHVKNKVANASKVNFTVEKKTSMVLKMQDLIAEKRFLFHEDNKHEVISSFMSIRKGYTPKTKQITYYSTRSLTDNGNKKHGELFWCAAMVCDGVEGLNYEDDNEEIGVIRI